MKGDDLAADLALEKVDLLLQRGGHPFHISRRLVCDLPKSPQTRVRFFVLIVRNPGDDLDAIPAVRERNIGQVNAEFGQGTGF